MNCFACDRTLAVDRLAERVDDAADHLVADRHRDDAARPLDGVAFLDVRRVAEQHGADALLFEVQRDAEQPVRELEHLAGHRALDAVNARDAVADRHDRAHFGDVHINGVVADVVADDLGDFFGLDLHSSSIRAHGPGPRPKPNSAPDAATTLLRRAAWARRPRCLTPPSAAAVPSARAGA